MVSQLVDTFSVITITYAVGGLAGIIDPARPVAPQLALLIATGYVFKFFKFRGNIVSQGLGDRDTVLSIVDCVFKEAV